jgi:hypothetical protein
VSTFRIHRSDPDGTETILTWAQFRDEVRDEGVPDGGGVTITEDITSLSFDDDEVLTFVLNSVGYTLLDTPKSG